MEINHSCELNYVMLAQPIARNQQLQNVFDNLQVCYLVIGDNESYIPIKDTYGPNFKVEKKSVLAINRKDNCPHPPPLPPAPPKKN